MILVFFVVIPLTAAAVDWCSDDLQCAYYDPPDNTMCRYKDEVETPRCTNVVNLQNDSSRQLMVMMHNDIRWWTAMGKIPGLPPASNMKMLRYDMTLEKIAYRWATQCMSAHDLCRKTPKWHALGQNISPNYSSTPYFEADPFTDFQAWWNHKKGIDLEIIDSYYVPLPSKMYMFTQIIWANTESIGCATIAYKRTTKSDPCPYERFTVCNYGPGGNIVNHPVYERGEPCSNCPAGDCICNVSPSLILDVPDDSKLESARNGARRKPIKRIYNVVSPRHSKTNKTRRNRQNHTREFWCREEMECPNEVPPVNTMCRYFDVSGTSRCSNVVNLITDCDREKVLRAHNFYRRKVAMGEVPGWPPAGNMRLLTYDKTLEDIAYRWAVQCMEGHDKCRKTEEWWSVGQNIAREYGGKQMLKTNPEGDVAAWFDEFRNADPKMIDGFFVKVNKDKRPTGHFLQLVWANTEKVGCAMISYKKMNTYSFYPFVRVTVCNYGPTGNVISYPVYSPVDPCPMNTKCVWDFKPSIIEKCNETNLGDLEYSDSTNPDSTYETSRDFSSKPGGRRAENLLFAHEEKNSSNIVVPGQLLYTYPPQLPQKSSLEHQHLGRYWDGEFVHATDAFQNMITPSSFSLLRTNKYRSNHCSMYHKDFQPSFVIAYEQPAAQFMSDLPRARFGTILQAHPGEEDFVATEDEFQDIFFSGAGQAEDLGLLSDVILKIRKNLFIESTEIDEEHQVPAEYDALDKLELEHEITGVHHHLVATTSSDVSEEQYKDLLVVTAEGNPTAALSTPRNEMPRMREATGENNDSLTLPSVTLLILNCLALWNKLSF